jgi:osmoprotectant transport system permease protein
VTDLGPIVQAPAVARGSETGGPAWTADRRATRLGRYLVMPAILVGACLALLLYLESLELDSIEKRRINVDFISTALWQHIKLTAVSTFFVVIIAVTLGVLLTRPGIRRVAPAVIAVTNVGQAIPSIGLIVLLALIWDVGFAPAVVALVAYSIVPVLRNTMVGLQQVDQSLIEAGRGMGMTRIAVLRRIELPLAVPVIMAGVRTALVLLVGTATLVTFINAGGLGAILQTGISLFRFSLMIAGAVLVALLALLIEWLGRVLELLTRPKGI